MTRETSRTIGNVILAIAAVLLLLTIGAMAGWVPGVWEPLEAVPLILVLAIIGFLARNHKSTAPPMRRN